MLEVVDFPAILGQEDGEVQVPDLGVGLPFELVVVWYGVRLADDAFAGDQEHFIELVGVIENNLELGEGRHNEPLAILPYTWQVLLHFDLIFLRIVQNLFNCEVVVWYLDLNNFLSPLLGWVLNNKESFVIVRIAGSKIIFFVFELHITVKFVYTDTILIQKLLFEEFLVHLINQTLASLGIGVILTREELVGCSCDGFITL